MVYTIGKRKKKYANKKKQLVHRKKSVVFKLCIN